MLSIRTRVTVKENGTVEAKLLGGELPPGEHDAVIIWMPRDQTGSLA